MTRTEILDKLAGREVVASVSGGKDSAALSLWLTEMGIPHRRVFMDTGWESPILYEYLRGPLTRALGPIEEIRSARYPAGMADLVKGRGMFPSRVRRMCTQELKVFPMRDYLRSLHRDGIDTVNAVGIRAAESESRSKMPEWEDSDTFDCEVWRPLIRWSEADVIAIHSRHNLAPCPLYLGRPGIDGKYYHATRVGCFPCIFARKAEVRMVAMTDPARINMIERLEAEVTELARARYAAEGQTFESLGYHAPSFFQARTPDEHGKWHTWSIRRAVEWSLTPTRGKHDEMFDDPHRGCMRWGVCETHPPEMAAPPPPEPAWWLKFT